MKSALGGYRAARGRKPRPAVTRRRIRGGGAALAGWAATVSPASHRKTLAALLRSFGLMKKAG